MQFNSIPIHDTMDSCSERSETEIVLRPYKHTHLKGHEKKNIIVRYFYVCNNWLKVPNEDLMKAASIASATYDMANILDDVQDETVLRKGFPASHIVYGIPSTVFAMQLALHIVLEKILRNYGLKLVGDLIYGGIRTVYGQILESYYVNNFSSPTEEECLHLIRFRGSYPVYSSVRFLESLSGKGLGYLAKMSELFGIFAFVANDYASLCPGEYESRKTFGDDITSGSFTFPITHGIQNCKDGLLLEILKEKCTDYERKMLFVNILKELGSFEYSKQKLYSLRNEILEEMEHVGKNPDMVTLVDDTLENLDADIYFGYCEINNNV